MKRILYLLLLMMLLFIGALFSYVSPVSIDSDQTYDRLFDDSIKHQIRVYMSRDEWLGMGLDILEAQKVDAYARTGHYRMATMEYEDEFGIQRIEDIGIRTKGNTSRVLPDNGEGVLSRAHFKIKFDYSETMNPSTLERTFLTLNELNLKSNMEKDLSYIREDFAYDLLQSYGVMTSKSSFSTLEFYIDDQLIDFGVYTMIEPINNVFIKNRYEKKADDGNLYKCLWQNFGPATLSKIVDKRAVGIKDWTTGYRPSYDLVTNNDDPNHEDLLLFTEKLSILKGDELKNYLDQNFEIHAFLEWLALNVSLGMPDDYWAMGNNYYLYFNPLGKVEFLPYDYDNSLGSGWDGAYFGGYEGIATSDILYWNDTASRIMNRSYSYPLVEKVLDVESYRTYYLEQFKIIMNDPKFSFDYFEKKANDLEELYKDDFSNVVNTDSKIDLYNAKWYFETRIESIMEQLDY